MAIIYVDELSGRLIDRIVAGKKALDGTSLKKSQAVSIALHYYWAEIKRREHENERNMARKASHRAKG